MERALVSVIVPVFNSAALLPECLDSLASQTYSNIEVLLVDDGSEDGSAGICDTYAALDSRFRVFHQPNKGVSAARNLALENVRGEWICFTDSDDTVRPDYLERLLDAVSNGYKLAECGFVEVGGNTKREILVSDAERLELAADRCIHDLALPLKGDNFYKVFLQGVLWNKIYHISIVKDLRFNETLHSHVDQLYNLEAFLKVDRIAYVPEPLYIYKVLNGSLCHPVSFDTEGNFQRSCCMMLDILPGSRREDRALLLGKLYGQMLPGLLVIKEKKENRSYRQICSSTIAVTASEFLRSKDVPALEKVKFLLVWYLTPLTKTVFKLLGN